MNNITFLIAGALGGVAASILVNWWLARRKKRQQEKIPLFLETHGLPAIDRPCDTMIDARYWLGRFHGILRAHVRRKPDPQPPATGDIQNPGIEFVNQDVMLDNLWREFQSHNREITSFRRGR